MMTTAQVNSTLDTLLGSSAYLALSTADPGADGAGLAEPVGNNYARVDIHAKFAAAAARGKTSNADIAFPTASGAWGTIAWWCIMDASSAGNPKWKGAFAAPHAVVSGETPTVKSGALSLTFDS